jgi:hypothetical protein
VASKRVGEVRGEGVGVEPRPGYGSWWCGMDKAATLAGQNVYTIPTNPCPAAAAN